MSNSDYFNRRKKEYNAQKKALLNFVKIKAGCAECGYNKHPQALTFDHIDPSTKSIFIADYGNYGWEKLLTEILKCRVLCANCHNIHSANSVDNGVESFDITSKIAQMITDILSPDLLKENKIPCWKSQQI
tara:strand:+ start:179 stop:571 length:393 start_codon:yes stop_codon:yes gene_type:complete